MCSCKKTLPHNDTAGLAGATAKLKTQRHCILLKMTAMRVPPEGDVPQCSWD